MVDIEVVKTLEATLEILSAPNPVWIPLETFIKDPVCALIKDLGDPTGLAMVADLTDPVDFLLGQRGLEETVGPLDERILLFCDLMTGVIVTLYSTSLRGLALACGGLGRLA